MCGSYLAQFALSCGVGTSALKSNSLSFYGCKDLYNKHVLSKVKGSAKLAEQKLIYFLYTPVDKYTPGRTPGTSDIKCTFTCTCSCILNTCMCYDPI